MAMSWLFGNKKKTLDTEPQQHIAELREDYVFVEEASNLQVGSEYGGPRPCPALPYSPAPDVGMVSNISTKNTMTSCHQNFLYGVPFKLYRDNVSLTHDAVNRRMHVNEIFLHISQLNLKSFEYDFLVEKSVALETGDLG